MKRRRCSTASISCRRRPPRRRQWRQIVSFGRMPGKNRRFYFPLVSFYGRSERIEHVCECVAAIEMRTSDNGSASCQISNSKLFPFISFGLIASRSISWVPTEQKIFNLKRPKESVAQGADHLNDGLRAVLRSVTNWFPYEIHEEEAPTFSTTDKNEHCRLLWRWSVCLPATRHCGAADQRDSY